MFNFIEIYIKLFKNAKIDIEISELDKETIKIEFLCDFEKDLFI
jgi:hypothetical protein